MVQSPLSSKGELAREKLKKAVTEVLAEVPFHQLRVKDVTEQAGVATGLFYHYFKDLRSLVTEVAETFIAQGEATDEIERAVSKGDWFSRLLSHYRATVAVYARHPGVVRCIAHLSADDVAFRNKWKASYHRQLRQLIDVFPHVFPGNELSPAHTQVLVYALGGVGQDFMQAYYVERDPELLKLNLTPDEMAEWLAVLFYRGLFASNPPRSKLQYAEKILTLKR